MTGIGNRQRTGPGPGCVRWTRPCGHQVSVAVCLAQQHQGCHAVFPVLLFLQKLPVTHTCRNPRNSPGPAESSQTQPRCPNPRPLWHSHTTHAGMASALRPGQGPAQPCGVSGDPTAAEGPSTLSQEQTGHSQPARPSQGQRLSSARTSLASARACSGSQGCPSQSTQPGCLWGTEPQHRGPEDPAGHHTSTLHLP